jgi:hypothetical protein
MSRTLHIRVCYDMIFVKIGRIWSRSEQKRDRIPNVS